MKKTRQNFFRKRQFLALTMCTFLGLSLSVNSANALPPLLKSFCTAIGLSPTFFSMAPLVQESGSAKTFGDAYIEYALDLGFSVDALPGLLPQVRGALGAILSVDTPDTLTHLLRQSSEFSGHGQIQTLLERNAGTAVGLGDHAAAASGALELPVTSSDPSNALRTALIGEIKAGNLQLLTYLRAETAKRIRADAESPEFQQTFAQAMLFLGISGWESQLASLLPVGLPIIVPVTPEARTRSPSVTLYIRIPTTYTRSAEAAQVGNPSAKNPKTLIDHELLLRAEALLVERADRYARDQNPPSPNLSLIEITESTPPAQVLETMKRIRETPENREKASELLSLIGREISIHAAESPELVAQYFESLFYGYALKAISWVPYRERGIKTLLAIALKDPKARPDRDILFTLGYEIVTSLSPKANMGADQAMLKARAVEYARIFQSYFQTLGYYHQAEFFRVELATTLR